MRNGIFWMVGGILTLASWYTLAVIVVGMNRWGWVIHPDYTSGVLTAMLVGMFLVLIAAVRSIFRLWQK